MDVRQRLTDGTARVRGGVIASMLLALVVACSQLVNLPRFVVPKTITKQFTVTGKLTVQQVIPGDGDTEVPLGAQVLVQFSRSVAPLTTLAAQPTDQVVTFDPPLHGTGEWLNTSIYRFIPT